MSLAIRIGGYVNLSFIALPNGLSLRDIEKIIKIYEGKYFDKDEAQSLIADCMCFMKKPIIEQRDVTKFSSINDIESFWKYKKGRYSLAYDEFKLTDEEKSLLEKIKKNPGEIKEYNPYNLCFKHIIENLTNHPKGISLNKLHNSFLEFSKKIKFHTEIAAEYNLNENHLIEESFVSIMGFDYAEPYNSVYLDKKDEERLKKGEFAHKPFIDWEYRCGLYYPTSNWFEENKEKIKKSEKSIKSLVRIIEDKTLLNFINEYCNIKNKSNAEFLRMHLFMQSHLDDSRK